MDIGDSVDSSEGLARETRSQHCCDYGQTLSVAEAVHLNFFFKSFL